MDTALNSRGKPIHAEHAIRGDRYQCPECKVRVLLNRGNERVAHFKHLPASSPTKSVATLLSYITDRGGLPPGRHRRSHGFDRLQKLCLRRLEKKLRTAPNAGRYTFRAFFSPSVEHVLGRRNINGSSGFPRRAVEKDRHVPVRVEANSTVAATARPDVYRRHSHIVA